MEKVETRLSFGKMLAFYSAKFFLTLICAVIASHYVVAGWASVKQISIARWNSFKKMISHVEVVKEYVTPESYSLETLIEMTAEKRKIPQVVLQALVMQESSNGTQLYRFEPKIYDKLKGKIKASDSEVRMLSSSHGPAHVMGYNAESRCGIHWSKLYDQAVGLDCGARILRENLDKHKEAKSAATKLRLALRDYNGSGPDAENYATEVMATIGDLLYANLKNEM